MYSRPLPSKKSALKQGRSEGEGELGCPWPPPPPLCKPFLSKQPTIFRGENAMTIMFDTVWLPLWKILATPLWRETGGGGGGQRGTVYIPFTWARKNLKFSFSFWIRLKCGLSGALPRGQVSKKSCLPGKKIYLFRTTGRGFLWALYYLNPHKVSLSQYSTYSTLCVTLFSNLNIWTEKCTMLSISLP